MSILQAIILGIAQGLFEFLPVSSSGHLVLIQNIFGITEGTLFFDSMLHLGTLIAVIFVYRKEILKMLRHPFSKLPMYIIIATIPTVIIALFFKDFFEQAYGGQYLGLGFIATGIILWLSSRLSKGHKKEKEMRVQDVAVMGLMQGLAIMPGVSRSGSTIAGGLFSGLDKEFAANFSFLMSIPAILGSAVLQFKDLAEVGLGQVEWLPVIIGMLCAAVFGFIAIKGMLAIIKRGKMNIFAVYTFVLGSLILLDQFIFHFVF